MKFVLHLSESLLCMKHNGAKVAGHFCPMLEVFFSGFCGTLCWSSLHIWEFLDEISVSLEDPLNFFVFSNLKI